MPVLFRKYRIKKAEAGLAKFNEQLAEFDRVFGKDENRPVSNWEFNAICMRSFYMQEIEKLNS